MTDDLISFSALGTRVGKLVEEKDAAYGSSVDCAGDFLKLLYPDGIPPNQYGDALLLVRIFDKMKRIATNRDAFGESPYQDISGYGLLGLRKAEREKWLAPSPNAMDIEPDEPHRDASSERGARLATMGEAMSMKNENPAFPPILEKDNVLTFNPTHCTQQPDCCCNVCALCNI